jgi:hypothetical protein
VQNGKREIPAALVYGTALTCGVLAAMAVQIQLSHAGFDFLDLWHSLFSGRAIQLRTAGPWWAMAGVAFVVSGAVAAALSRVPPPWHRLRLLRWLAGAAIVLLLSDTGHRASALPPAEAAAQTSASLGVLAIAAIMALCGAYLTARR